jgi:general secretion pathway protein A
VAPAGQAPSLALVRLAEEELAPELDLEEVTMDRGAAMQVLLRRWGVELKDLGRTDPCERVSEFGLNCEWDQGGWHAMRLLDRPALIKLAPLQLPDRYAVVAALDAEFATLEQLRNSRRVSLAALDAYWDGEYMVLWQRPPVGGNVIGPATSGEPVRWLRKLLSQVPDLELKSTNSGTYDGDLRNTVRKFQEGHGLEVDGIAGPKTLIHLHNAVGMPEIPSLKAKS